MGFLYNLKYLILCMEKQFSAKGSTDFIGLPTGVPATERMKKPSSRGQWCLESLRAVRVGAPRKAAGCWVSFVSTHVWGVSLCSQVQS